MADEAADKTEPATPKRREDAKRKGEVAQSRELATVVVLTTALLAGGSFLGLNVIQVLGAQAQEGWGGARSPATVGDFHAALLHHGSRAGLALLPILLLLAASGALSQLVQTGPLFSPEALQFRFDRMDPVKGLKKMVNVDRIVELGKALLKVVVVGGVSWALLRGQLDGILSLFGGALGDSLSMGGALAQRVALWVLAALAALAAFDVGWQRFRWEQRMRMSRSEVRDELKQREGNPQVRSRSRSMAQEMNRQRMIAAVADADVVITNPTEYAVALSYERGEMGAPRVVAKGRNHVALRIREAARKAGVPLVENPPLARSLHRSVQLGREIPEALFQAVAEVLASVYRLRKPRARGATA